MGEADRARRAKARAFPDWIDPYPAMSQKRGAFLCREELEARANDSPEAVNQPRRSPQTAAANWLGLNPRRPGSPRAPALDSIEYPAVEGVAGALREAPSGRKAPYSKPLRYWKSWTFSVFRPESCFT